MTPNSNLLKFQQKLLISKEKAQLFDRFLNNYFNRQDKNDEILVIKFITDNVTTYYHLNSVFEYLCSTVMIDRNPEMRVKLLNLIPNLVIQAYENNQVYQFDSINLFLYYLMYDSFLNLELKFVDYFKQLLISWSKIPYFTSINLPLLISTTTTFLSLNPVGNSTNGCYIPISNFEDLRINNYESNILTHYQTQSLFQTSTNFFIPQKKEYIPPPKYPDATIEETLNSFSQKENSDLPYQSNINITLQTSNNNNNVLPLTNFKYPYDDNYRQLPYHQIPVGVMVDILKTNNEPYQPIPISLANKLPHLKDKTNTIENALTEYYQRIERKEEEGIEGEGDKNLMYLGFNLSKINQVIHNRYQLLYE
ncbi:hypothetical protein K502DRAFT_367175 [Neoconidiobolus thromboides FSU 785]|nr:hypothetical protein K502DRAFT_367175 [Neoconidiobolus thromboides FSU 785]